MGLIAGSDKITSAPPNNPAEWLSTPNPQFVAGTSANYDLASICFDADGDTITFSLGATSNPLPDNVTLSGNNIICSASASAGTTTGIVVVADDGTAVTSSPIFSIKVSAVATGTILWTGTVESGSFEEWHYNSDPNFVQFPNVHNYGRPPDYSNANHTQTQTGNGELLDIVSATGAGGFDTGPARVGDKSIRFRIKNSVEADATGSPFHPIFTSTRIDKFDPSSGNPPTDQSRQRTTIADTKFTVSTDLAEALLPAGVERWYSISFYLPSDFPVINQDSGFMTMHGTKGSPTVSSGPYSAPIRGWTGILIEDNSWQLRETWMSEDMYTGSPSVTNEDYRYAYFYNKDGCNATPLEAMFPDATASKAALGNLNLGGWTDFIFHFKDDTSEPAATNTGYLDVYMRANTDPWVHVLASRPLQFTYDSQVIEKGIGVYGAKYSNMAMGIYCSYFRVWTSSTNGAICYVDNVKVGDENVSFQQMTPDGSSPP